MLVGKHCINRLVNGLNITIGRQPAVHRLDECLVDNAVEVMRQLQ